MPGLGLGLSLSNSRGALAAPGPVYDFNAADWFIRVETAGSTFAAGAKNAYNTFITQLKADNNFNAFNNGMILFFAGFTGLGGCFIPLASRSLVLPTNVGFVAGQKSVNALQGNAVAYANSNLPLLASQQNNHCFGFYNSTIHSNTTSVLIGNSDTGGAAGSAEIFDNTAIQRVIRSSATQATTSVARSTGIFFVNRVAASQYTYYSAAATQLVGTNTTPPLANNMHFFSANGGGAASNAAHQAIFFGDALPAPAAFRTALNTLMTTLGV